MSTKAKVTVTKPSLDLDISDVVGPTKKIEIPIKTEEPSPPTVPVLEQNPVQEASPPTKQQASSVPSHPTYGPFIPLRLPNGDSIMKPVADCTGQEFISWASTVLPLPGKINSALYNVPETRETTFNRIVHALGSQFLFGGLEYKKRKYSN